MTATYARDGVTDQSVDLWLLHLAGLSSSLIDCSELSAAESQRAARYRRAADRMQFRAAHVGLRRVLAGYLAVSAKDVRFTRERCPLCDGDHGRPALEAPGSSLHFSLSHTEGYVLLAVACAPVGVDVERVATPQFASELAGVLHSSERAELEAVAPAERGAKFTRQWTRKEAYLKSIGTGLGRDLAADYLGADVARRPPGCTILDVDVDAAHVGAVAVHGVVRKTRLTRLSDTAISYPAHRPRHSCYSDGF